MGCSAGTIHFFVVAVDVNRAFYSRSRLTRGTGPRFHCHTKGTSHRGGNHGAGVRAGATAHFRGEHTDSQVGLVLCPQGNTAVAVAHLG